MEIKRIVLKYKNSTDYVALDAASTGYPYRVQSPLNAKIFDTLERATQCNYNNEFDIVELTLNISEKVL